MSRIEAALASQARQAEAAAAAPTATVLPVDRNGYFGGIRLRRKPGTGKAEATLTVGHVSETNYGYDHASEVAQTTSTEPLTDRELQRKLRKAERALKRNLWLKRLIPTVGVGAVALGGTAACSGEQQDQNQNQTVKVNGTEYILIDNDGSGGLTPGDQLYDPKTNITVTIPGGKATPGSTFDPSEFGKVDPSATPDTGKENPTTQNKQKLMDFTGYKGIENKEMAAKQWAVDNLAGNDPYLQNPDVWHLNDWGGLHFDETGMHGYKYEHVKLDTSKVKDRVMVQGYRNIDLGNGVEKADAYVIVGEDSFLLKEGTIAVADRPLNERELANFGNEGYDGAVKAERADQIHQVNVRVHAVGFNPNGFEACAPIKYNSDGSPQQHLNVFNIQKEFASKAEQDAAKQAFANFVGTDDYTKNGANYSFDPNGYGGIVLKEDSTPGIHHEIDLSRLPDGVMVQYYQDVRLDGNPKDGWMRDAFAWINDQRAVDGKSDDHTNKRIWLRGATFWVSKDAVKMTISNGNVTITANKMPEQQYVGQVGYLQAKALETPENGQFGVETHLEGAPKPEPSPAC